MQELCTIDKQHSGHNSAFCVECARSPCDRMTFFQVFWFPLTSKDMCFGRLFGQSTLWMDRLMGPSFNANGTQFKSWLQWTLHQRLLVQLFPGHIANKNRAILAPKHIHHSISHSAIICCGKKARLALNASLSNKAHDSHRNKINAVEIPESVASQSILNLYLNLEIRLPRNLLL